MQKFTHILAITFLALFIAGSVVHAVSANAISLEMALGIDDAMNMPDCQGCIADEDGNTKSVACDLICTAPMVATIGGAVGSQHIALPPRHERPLGMNLPVGLRASPDPFPPRTLI